MNSRPLLPLDFRRALGHFATGVTVVTVESASHNVHGMTANSFTSVSLEPPLVSVCVDQNAHLLPLLKQGGKFGINILRDDQQKLSEYFSRPEQSKREEDALHVHFRWSAEAIPLMEDVLCQIACRLYSDHVAGDHTIVVGEVISATLHEGSPLLFFRGQYTRLSR